MRAIIHDLRYALRSLARAPLFTFVVVATLGLVLGANATVFALLDRVVLRPLPVPQPEQLVIVSAPPLPTSGPSVMMGGRTRRGSIYGLSYPLYRVLRDEVPSFSGVVARRGTRGAVLAGSPPVQISPDLVSGNYLRVLGVRAAIGRILEPDDDVMPRGRRVAVLAHAFWHRQFAGDVGVLGRTVRVNQIPLTVVGVLEGTFTGTTPGTAPDLFVPLSLADELAPTGPIGIESPGNNVLDVMARLRPGVSLEEARAKADLVYLRLADQLRGGKAAEPAGTAHLRLLPGGSASSRESMATWEIARPLTLVMAMVALLLLIAAANVTNVLLARGAARARELAVRVALGANRWSLLRERLAESLVLMLGAGGVGIAVAAWLGDLAPLLLPSARSPQALTAAPDGRVLLFTAAVSIGTAIAMWLMSAVQVTRRSALPSLAAAGSPVASRSPLRIRRALVVLQLALSMALLGASALLATSLYNLMRVDPGFVVEGLWTFMLQDSTPAPDAASTAQHIGDLVARVQTLPGVQATLSDRAPLDDALSGVEMQAEPAIKGREPVVADVTNVGADYFRTLGIPLVSGRDVSAEDIQRGTDAVVANEALARALFGRTDVVGQAVRYGDSRIAIVGVARDGRTSLRRAARPAAYVPFAPDRARTVVHVFARVSGRAALTAAGVRSIVGQTMPSAAATEPRRVSEVVAESAARERMLASVSVCFALLAAMLSGIGLYGLASFGVARRMREFGIRLALGASGGQVVRIVIGETAALAAVGGLAGLALFLALKSLLQSFLFGLTASAPIALAASALSLVTITLAAAWLPARHAAGLDPAVTLREQ